MASVTADKVIVELEAKLGRYNSDVRGAQQNFERSMTGMQTSAMRTETAVLSFAKSIVGCFRCFHCRAIDPEEHQRLQRI